MVCAEKFLKVRDQALLAHRFLGYDCSKNLVFEFLRADGLAGDVCSYYLVLAIVRAIQSLDRGYILQSIIEFPCGGDLGFVFKHCNHRLNQEMLDAANVEHRMVIRAVNHYVDLPTDLSLAVDNKSCV